MKIEVGNIIPTQFSEAPAFPSYTAKETEEQILQKLNKRKQRRYCVYEK
jgi:hypothetical protein